MRKITPCLWFSGNAEEAVDFYLSVFRNSRRLQVTHYGEGSRMPKGSVLTITFQLEGQDFTALNGDMEFKFNESLSLVVNCDTQQEIDTLWEKLTADGGEPGQCGWLKDRFGVSWQLTPSAMQELISDQDPARADRVLHALMPMTKPDLRVLRQAADAS